MAEVVSDWAFCCAHCGWLEPDNLADIEKQECGEIMAVITHQGECTVKDNPDAHELFMSLWNARTHMEMNDVLLRRIDENTRESMQKYVNENLNEKSYFITKSDFVVNPE